MSRTTKSTFRRAGMGVALMATFAVGALWSAPQANAAFFTIVDSVGFEKPKFDPGFSNSETNYNGQLEGQAPFPEPFPVGTWLQTHPVGNYTSKATVVGGVFAPGGGTQSVKVDRGANTDARWAVPVDGWPSERYVCIDWDMRVEQTVAADPSQFGPFFGVEAYDDDATSIGLLGSLGVDATTGEVLFQDGGAGEFVAGPIVSFGTWNHFTIVLDYGTNTYQALVNNILVATEEFVDHAEIPGGLNQFTDANISALAAGGDAFSQAATGTAYFDNFKVLESNINPCVIIPEPASVALAGVALAALGAMRRRK